jgi:hypothetical protein
MPAPDHFDHDLGTALDWINKALSYAPEAYWFMHTKAEIQGKMGDYKDAIETATKSLELAEAKNDVRYITMNKTEIANWKELKKNRVN